MYRKFRRSDRPSWMEYTALRVAIEYLRGLPFHKGGYDEKIRDKS